MGIWRKLRALSLAEIFLLIEATASLSWAWASLRLLPSGPLLQRPVDSPLPENLPSQPGTPARVAWAIRAMAHRLPARMTCLVQALAARSMLRRRSYPSALRIGVAGPEPGGGIRAHAWVEQDGKVIIGDLEDLGTYAVLSSPSGR